MSMSQFKITLSNIKELNPDEYELEKLNKFYNGLNPNEEISQVDIYNDMGDEFLLWLMEDTDLMISEPEIFIPCLNDGFFLHNIENPSYEVELEAVKINHWNFNWVKVQTPELCIIALESNTASLKDVKVQTPELCRMMIERDYKALKYIRKPSLELCQMAVKINHKAIIFSPLDFFELLLLEISKNESI